jgi:hypothetical protein
MIFLLEYDRKHGAICKRKIFDADQRAQAQIERLAIELELHKSGTLHEVVLLEAADETALMRTHERYFKSPQKLIESMIQPEPNPG